MEGVMAIAMNIEEVELIEHQLCRMMTEIMKAHRRLTKIRGEATLKSGLSLSNPISMMDKQTYMHSRSIYTKLWIIFTLAR
jgi:hypothetical protein